MCMSFAVALYVGQRTDDVKYGNVCWPGPVNSLCPGGTKWIYFVPVPPPPHPFMPVYSTTAIWKVCKIHLRYIKNILYKKNFAHQPGEHLTLLWKCLPAEILTLFLFLHVSEEFVFVNLIIKLCFVKLLDGHFTSKFWPTGFWPAVWSLYSGKKINDILKEAHERNRTFKKMQIFLNLTSSHDYAFTFTFSEITL